MTKNEREELRRIHTAELYSCMEALSSGKTSVGADEVGRGALAGPLMVAAVALPSEPQLVGLDDSKKLSAKRREELADAVREYALGVGLGRVEPAEIDELGMATALRLAFGRAVERCPVEPEVLLVDGNPLHMHPREKGIVKGDGTVACIAAASIVAKVARDTLMADYGAQYPQYGFEGNKGYGTAAHIAAIREHGPCVLHRMSFLGRVLAEQQELF